MLANLRNIWRPGNYHGWGKKAPFFEGWYFKLVDAGQTHAHAVIPGVFIGAEADASHAFIQTLDGITGKSTYHRYPFEAFRASDKELDISVGPNRFRAGSIHLDVATPERQIQGDLSFTGLSPWPVAPASPGIMGWYAFVPFMECYHGVVSLDHTIQGSLAIDGVGVDFTGGRGYIEKDWGQSFPKAWFWTQTNHFSETGTSLTASVAVIPWLGGAFNGFIAGLWRGGKLYRFATYSGAKLERLAVSDRQVTVQLADRPSRRPGYRLEITAERARGGLLRSPERTAMLQRVMETLTATVHVRLIEQEGGQVLFEDSGKHAGLELVGDLPGAIRE